MKLHFAPYPGISRLNTTPLVITVGEGNLLGDFAKSLDKACEGFITRALAHAPKFKGESGQTLRIVPPKNCKARTVYLVGLGKKEAVEPFAAYHIGGNIMQTLAAHAEAHAILVLEDIKAYRFTAEAVAGVAAGLHLKAYRFSKYKTKESAESKKKATQITLASPFAAAAKKAFVRHNAIAEGMCLTRDMGNEPPNVMTPLKAAQTAQSLRKLKVTVEILDEKRLQKIGMGSLLSVAQGSKRPPRVVVMRYHGAGKAPFVAFVGKGVTFDTGGINLKPFANMWDMKFDMQGAATVVGTLHALARRKAKVNAVGVVGFVENMPDGNAYRPGDILTSLSGQTIEVQNTDAEGRLVLNDLLWYTQERFKPRVIIDLATLTGACVAALGNLYAGLFSNSDSLAENLHDIGHETGDFVWHLPLDPEYDKQLTSDYADMRNIGNAGEAGAVTAAQFLQRFIKKGQDWAHIDIAGTAYTSREYVLGPKGATAFGVRLLDHWVYENHEKR